MDDLYRDPSLIEGFFEEAHELLQDLEQCLLALEATPGDPEVLNRAFRSAHTIKGNSGMLGFEEITQFTHALEEVLDRLRKGRLASSRAMDTLLASVDVLKGLLASARGEGAPPKGRDQILTVMSSLSSLISSLGSSGSSALEEPHKPNEPHKPDNPSEEDGFGLFGQTGGPGDGELKPGVFRPEASVSGLPSPVSMDTGSIRVSLEKVDKLINLAGELAIANSMVVQLVSRFSLDKLPLLQQAVAEVERHARELQERIMGIRMLPIRNVFHRFPRLVRDLAGQLGKRITLVASGEETELDKLVIEKIVDPLTHLVRNAVDHGIEPPDVRLKQGKPEQGTIQLHAYQQGGSIFIEVADDGRGLDRDRILRKGIEAGLVTADEALSDDRVFSLIFEPGFSTAEQVTETSGRGVGMDVVKRNIEALGGSIAIQSQPGRGTRFTITLPMTLAILDGQLLQVGREVYILPLVNIVESLRPRIEEVRTVFGRGEVLRVRGEVVPILKLYEVFGVEPVTPDPTRGLLVIVESDRGKVALLVDELLEQQQVVIKSLEANFQKVPGVAGATILGDGRVALILDVPGLLARARMNGGQRRESDDGMVF